MEQRFSTLHSAPEASRRREGEQVTTGPAGDPVVREATDLDSDYSAAGFSGHLGWGARPAVIAIDVCRAYVDPESPLYAGVEAAAASIGRLTAAARVARIPVIWTKVEYEPGGADGGVFFRKVGALQAFVRGNPLGDFLVDVRPAAGERIVVKQYPSAFFETGLAEELHAEGIDTVVLCGFSTSGCVRASCVDAVSSGLIPIVVADACGDRDVRPHEANLFDMNAKYGDVVSEADALAHFAALAR